ncbi:MAG: hypothetical protein GY765_06075, partial [bacterium]|nr:hypothetical protein [bacterium]
MIVKRFEEQVKAWADKPAVVTARRTMTYSELNTYADSIAAEIRKHKAEG